VTILSDQIPPDKPATPPASPPRPTALPVRPEHIPAELTAVDRWVVWRYVADVDPATREVTWDKPPVNTRTGGLASSTNPRTWSPFDVALAACRRRNLDGIGFVLHRKPDDASEGLVGGDLDHCRDRVSGAILPWAQAIIHTFNTYAEASPSGTGVRLFLLGKLPPWGRRRGNFEVYETGRYVTVTGQHIAGTPRVVAHRQAELEQVHRDIFGAAPSPGPSAPGARGRLCTLSDAEILHRAGKARNGPRFLRLWQGNTAGYRSRSEADLALVNALAFWTGGDSERMDSLFRQSGLFRAKWDRADYCRRTIDKALDGRTEFYAPRHARRRLGGIHLTVRF
jgi:primase-polymerase (primpol)-like protein